MGDRGILTAHAGVAWHPAAEPGAGKHASVSSGSVALATASADNTARLWTEEGKLLRALEGHTDRCSCLFERFTPPDHPNRACVRLLVQAMV